MGDRLKGKIAVVMGAGQTPGETIGNGRASAILYAREGAKVIVVDYRLNSAEDTCQMIAKEGGLKVRPSLSKLMRPRVTIVKKSPMSVFNALVVSIFSTIMLVLVTMMAD
jgi:NAD(P)-dependent dehydrogenase (short-subunit alcohol dehydrogenase family)